MSGEHPVMLVTGARKGIGRYLVEHYLKKGYAVEGCSRGKAELDNPLYRHHEVDVADEKGVRRMVADITKRHGRIDAVLNNAAIASMNHVLLTPAKSANRMLEVNVTGTMLVCRDAAKVMMRRKYGRIVNFTTIVAPIALAGEAVYAASKSAVVTFTRILAFELGQWGITCNSFGATPIMTDMIKGVPQDKINAVVNNLAIKRLGSHEDCANVCDFFVSPTSDNITGQVIYLAALPNVTSAMNADWFFQRLLSWGDRPALVAAGQRVTYGELLVASTDWGERLRERGVTAGSVVAIEGSFSLNACGAFLAAMRLGAVLVPLTPLMRAHREKFVSIAEVTLLIELDAADGFTLIPLAGQVTNPLTLTLVARQHPGLVIFSSGSTGVPKAILHDLAAILEKFRKVRQQKTTLTFLLFDHIGGIDTMLNTFGSGGCVVTVAERTPELVANAIEEYAVHTLPASPTFLNLFLISGVWEDRDLSSLKVIAYGTEPMPQSTLERLHQVFPDVALVQTYGMSELGVLRSRSRDSTSLWIKFTGDEFKTKILDGILWVKADSAMLGYLNAPDLFDAEGWLNTQDAVEVDGEYLRILGRKSDLINVGGQKVYPAEVENLLLQMDNVAEVAVFGKPHPMMGQIVAARFSLKQPEPLDLFKRRMNGFCRERLAKFQIPMFVELAESSQFGARFKKLRQ